MAAMAGKQDMPPPGGYGPIQIDRIPIRQLLNWKMTLAGFTVVTVSAWVMMYRQIRAVKREKVEKLSAELAVTPLLIAEKDRALLRHMRKMREWEMELMKDYPRWEVGTVFGDPIYRTLSKDTFVKPIMQEAFANTELSINNYVAYLPHFT